MPLFDRDIFPNVRAFPIKIKTKPYGQKYNARYKSRDRERMLIEKISQSFIRIEEGTYGICDMCGEEITVQRLKARPVTTFCIINKNKMESLEETIGM